jgi:O-acetyl-ADP-ribose deacetylase (regulator of RNase III)
MEKTIEGVEITTKVGDIVEEKVDAIVNPANTSLKMGGGVAKALKDAGGDIIETEANLKGPIQIGESIATGSGKLGIMSIIHSAVMGEDHETSPELIRKATQSTMETARMLGVRSIAFPSFGTGVGGLDYNVSAENMIPVIIESLSDKSPNLEKIIFVLYEEEALNAFDSVLEAL